MARNEALGKAPTIEEEMAKFKTFSTTDGEVSEGGETEDEKRAHAANAARLARGEEESDESDEETEEDDAENETDELRTDAENDGESDEEDETETEETDEQRAAREAAEKAKKPGKLTAKQRVRQAVGRQHAAEAETATLRGELAAMERRMAALEGKGGLTQQRDATTTENNKAPDPRDFEFGELDPKYINAMVDHRVALKMAETSKAQREQEERVSADRDAVKEREQRAAFEEAGNAEFDDFHEVVVVGARAKTWALSPTVGKLILSSDVGPKVAYHLASNPKEARQLYGKTPMEQAAAFGRLEAQFSSTSDVKTKGNGQQPKPKVKTTKAPPPLNGARGAGGNAQVAGDTKDFLAFERIATRQ